jgi:hypothetical protein
LYFLPEPQGQGSLRPEWTQVEGSSGSTLVPPGRATAAPAIAGWSAGRAADWGADCGAGWPSGRGTVARAAAMRSACALARAWYSAIIACCSSGVITWT